MLAPILAIAAVWLGAAAIILRAAKLHRDAHTGRHTRSDSELPIIAQTGAHSSPHMPRGNPWRVGSTVLVCEDITQPELNWFGTVLQTNRNMLTVRDLSAPYHSIELEKEKVWHAETVF